MGGDAAGNERPNAQYRQALFASRCLQGDQHALGETSQGMDEQAMRLRAPQHR
jgi:hypothetical protein